MTDDRRKLIAEAMEARARYEAEPKGARKVGLYDTAATLTGGALPVAAELIEELTAKLRRSRVMVEAQTADIERCERAIVREEVRATQAEATIATQAAEIERLKKRVTQLLDEAADADEAEERLLDKCNDRIEQVNEQAKEIERLRAAIGCGHPNLRRTDITGTDVHGDGQ